MFQLQYEKVKCQLKAAEMSPFHFLFQVWPCVTQCLHGCPSRRESGWLASGGSQISSPGAVSSDVWLRGKFPTLDQAGGRLLANAWACLFLCWTSSPALVYFLLFFHNSPFQGLLQVALLLLLYISHTSANLPLFCSGFIAQPSQKRRDLPHWLLLPSWRHTCHLWAG